MLVLTAVVVCQAEYIPMLKVGRSWIVAYEEEHYGEVSYVKMKVTRLSLINGKRYKLDIFSVEEKNGEWIEGDLISEDWLNEEEGVVYRLNPYTGDKNELLSFNLQVGDYTSEEYKYECPQVMARFEAEVTGQVRTCIYAGDYTSNHSAWIVEGIGASVSVWQSTVIPTCSDWTFHYSYMVECWQDDECIFTQKDFENLEVPGATIGSVKAEETTDLIQLFDLWGNPVSFPREGKIYVSNGKKILL